MAWYWWVVLAAAVIGIAVFTWFSWLREALGAKNWENYQYQKMIKEMEEEYGTLHTYENFSNVMQGYVYGLFIEIVFTVFALINIKKLDSEKFFLFVGIVLLADFSNYFSTKNQIRDKALAADEKRGKLEAEVKRLKEELAKATGKKETQNQG